MYIKLTCILAIGVAAVACTETVSDEKPSSSGSEPNIVADADQAPVEPSKTERPIHIVTDSVKTACGGPEPR